MTSWRTLYRRQARHWHRHCWMTGRSLYSSSTRFNTTHTHLLTVLTYRRVSADVTAALQCIDGRLQVFPREYRRVSADVTAALRCIDRRLQVFPHEYRRVSADVTAALQCIDGRLQVFPHEYRRVLAEKAMAEEQAKLTKHGSFILEYQEEDIISQELLKKEAVCSMSVSVCLSVCLCPCLCPCVCVSVEC